MRRVVLSSVLAVCGALLLAARPASLAAQASAAKPTLGVIAFTNAAMREHAEWEYQRQGIAELVTTALRYHPAVVVLEREQLQPLLAEQDLVTAGRVDPAAAARIGKLLGAQYMLLGTINVNLKNQLRLAARAVDVETSRIVGGEIVEGDADDVMVLVDQLTDKLLKGLKLPPLPPRGEPGNGSGNGSGTGSGSGPGAGERPSSTGAASTTSSAPKGNAPGGATAPAGGNAATGNAATGASSAGAPAAKGAVVRTVRTAKALNKPLGGKDGYKALRLLSQAVQAEDAKRVDDASNYYKLALQVQPDLVAAQDRLARLRKQ